MTSVTQCTGQVVLRNKFCLVSPPQKSFERSVQHARWCEARYAAVAGGSQQPEGGYENVCDRLSGL